MLGSFLIYVTQADEKIRQIFVRFCISPEVYLAEWFLGENAFHDKEKLVVFGAVSSKPTSVSTQLVVGQTRARVSGKHG